MNQTMETPIDTEISNLKDDIQEYRKALNDEGIWLFITTLGCWGVTSVHIRLVAISIAFILFTWRMKERNKNKQSFANSIKFLEERIKMELTNDVEKDARFYRLLKIHESELSSISSMKRAWPFAVSWVFMFVTIFYSFYLLSHPAKA